MKKKLEIKHERLTFDEWNCSILEKKVYLAENKEQYYALIDIVKVKERQIWNVFNEYLVVADNGYKWLVVLPKGKNYAVTMFMNDKFVPIVLYIDLIDGYGVDEDGVCYYNDIFLDLLVSVEGQIVEEDREEFEKAYVENIISERQYKQANITEEKLKQKIITNPKWILEYCQKILALIKEEILLEKCKIYK